MLDLHEIREFSRLFWHCGPSLTSHFLHNFSVCLIWDLHGRVRWSLFCLRRLHFGDLTFAHHLGCWHVGVQIRIDRCILRHQQHWGFGILFEQYYLDISTSKKKGNKVRILSPPTTITSASITLTLRLTWPPESRTLDSPSTPCQLLLGSATIDYFLAPWSVGRSRIVRLGKYQINSVSRDIL